MPRIYVIIVTYNAMQWAGKCFSSLRTSSVPVFTIAVDNGSADGTQEFIQKNYPEVHLVQNDTNLGFGKANNLGIETAYKFGADFFYLMNQDAWIFNDTFQKMLTVYESCDRKHEIGILSPMHFDKTGQQLDIFLDKYIAQNFQNRLISDLYFNSLKSAYELNFVNAAHWLLPKETVEKVGGFNPYFFHYGEDNEYVNRLHFHGKKILLCPESKVIHAGKQDLLKVDYAKYADLALETKILNPGYQNSLKLELKSLRMSWLKNFLSGNFSLAATLCKKYKTIQSDAAELTALKLKVSLENPTFLNI